MKKQKEIKFRQLIWDYEADIFLMWHYWGFIGKDKRFIPPQINGVNPENNYQSQQYTGLLDSKEKEIYEGDIVKVNPIDSDYETGDWDNYVVMWSKEFTGFVLGQENGDLQCGFTSADGKNKQKNIEIIGNIYEHASLLDNK